MNAELDIGPLSWVKDEIELALGQVAAQSQKYATQKDASALAEARAYLHQAHGALTVVGLEGVTEFSRAIEQLLDDLLQDETLWAAAVGDTLQEAVSVLRNYLEELATGRPDQALRLLPVYRRLNEARGVLDTASSELFFPDLGQRPPRRDSAAIVRDEASQQLRLKAARLGFERGLSKWLKQDSSAFRDMRNSIAIIESLQDQAVSRAFWWVALAYFDALAAGGIAENDTTRQLCERIGAQVTKLLDGTKAVAERLMRDVLYEVATTPASSDHIEQVRSAYRLRELIPFEPMAADPREAMLREIRDCMGLAGQSWEQFCAGAAIALPRFHEQSTQLAQLVEQLDHVDLTRLTTALANTANMLRKNPLLHTDALGKEMATALVFVEHAVNRVDDVDEDFANQIDSLTGRLAALQRGEALPAQDNPALQLLAQQAESRFVIHHVVADLRVELQQAELGLDAYFRDAANRGVLADAAASLLKAAHMFEQLGQSRAIEVTQGCMQQIAIFLAPEYQRQSAEFEEIARKISALEFFVEQLQYGHADLDALLVPVVPKAIAAAPTVEAELTHTKRMARTLVNALRDAPPDQHQQQSLRSELKQNLENVRDNARLVADKNVERQADIALNEMSRNATPERIEAVVSKLVAKLAADELRAPTITSAALAKAGTNEVDGDIMAIFLDEVKQVLETIHDASARSAAVPQSPEHITTLRRAFHLLKGSSRMLGLQDFSDTVWAVEATLGRYLRSGKPATAELLAMVDTAQGVVTEWAGCLENGQNAPDTGLLLSQCKMLTQASTQRQTQDQASQSSAEKVLLSTPSSLPEAANAAAMLKVGPLQLERSIYETYLGEAREHLVSLRQHWQRVPTLKMIRAAQALGSSSATLGFVPLERLTGAFKSALERFAQAGHASDAAQDTALQMGLRRIGAMVQSIADKHYPRADEEIAAWLDALMPSESVAVETLSEAGETVPQSIANTKDHDLLSVFLTECEDLVPSAVSSFRTWRNEGAVGADALQRILHTLKGGARMSGAREIGEAVHDIETRITESQTKSQTGSGHNATPTEIDEIESRFQGIVSRIDGMRAAQAGVADGRRPVLRVPADLVDTMVNESGEISIARSRIEGGVKVLRSSLGDLHENVARLRMHLRELEIQAESRIQSTTQLRDALRNHARVSSASEGKFDPLEMDRFTRLQELTRILAESVDDVATVQHSLTRDLDGVDNALAQQARLSRELTQHLMGVRMVPFSSITERLQRVVRLTAEEAGKSVVFLIEGGETKIDRSVLEGVIGPIEHLLRNAIVHGIETADKRVAADKPEQGDVRLSLAQAGNEVVICVSDDGAGIDYARIRSEAVKRGLFAAEQKTSDTQLTQLIFQPGFTTATQLSEIAGRGVGMDVVRSETLLLGGRIEVDSLPGQGAVFTLHLPLTLAVIPVVLVKSGTRTFAIPSSMVAHAMEVKPEAMAQLRLDTVVQWKNQHFNLRYLPHLLGDAAMQALSLPRQWVLLLRGGAQRIALEVDALVGNEEVVIKNTGPQLASMPGIGGATVLADGEVVLILNPIALASVQLSTVTRSVMPSSEQQSEATALPVVMVVDDSLTVRKVTTRFLERAGYRVLTAKDGVDALEQLTTTKTAAKPIVVLADIEMPRMDGFELLRHLRANEKFKTLPVIMITSRIADKHHNHALELGANHYLGKPYDETALLAIIAEYVGK